MWKVLVGHHEGWNALLLDAPRDPHESIVNGGIFVLGFGGIHTHSLHFGDVPSLAGYDFGLGRVCKATGEHILGHGCGNIVVESSHRTSFRNSSQCGSAKRSRSRSEKGVIDFHTGLAFGFRISE